tara:strand:- start:975 stop:2930 length:1956 start_codon:yes stop_codon:yes gene_type:complete
MEITCPSSFERRVRHVVSVEARNADAAWNRLRDAAYAYYVSTLPWLKWKHEHRSDGGDAMRVEVDIVVSRTMGFVLGATIDFEWHAERRRMVAVTSVLGDVLCRSVIDVAVSEDGGHVELHHGAHVRLPTRLATPFLDAKLERAFEHVAGMLRDAVETRRAHVAPPVVEAAVDARGRRCFSSTLTMVNSAEAFWKHARQADALLGRAASVASVTCREKDANSSVLDVELTLSQSLGISAHAGLALAFDDAARVLRITTQRCRWGTFEATLGAQEREDGEGCVVAFECSFVPRLPLPFLERKLRSLAEQLVHTLCSSSVRALWRDEFLSTFDALVVRPLLRAPDLAQATRFDDVVTHLRTLLHETVVGGKAYRAMIVRLTVEALGGGMDDRVHAAAWMNECFQACALVADDIMDGSETRRGKACWYRTVGVPMAINDSLLLFSCAYRVLSHHFATGPLFDKLARLMFDTALQTCVGQYLDASSEGVLEHAHAARVDAIVHYKTTYYTIYNPMAMGIVLSQRPDEDALLENARAVSEHIGRLFQESDDYLDVYGRPEVTGKVGTDVVDGKTTWMLAFALEHYADDTAPRDELRALYGTDQDQVRVRALFDAAGVPAQYRKRQKEGAAECLAAASAPLRSAVSILLAEMLHRKA